MTRALVLFSGGKDSTVALAWAVREFEKTVALAFDVPYRPAGEQRSAKTVANTLNVKYETVPLPFLVEVAQLQRTDEVHQTTAAYVPARNLIFHTVAFHLAQCWGFETVVAGHVDSDGSAYTDATSEYLNSIYSLASDGADPYGALGNPRLALPLAGMRDKEVARFGRQLDAPLMASWSCLEDGTEPCGRCVSCRDRHEAFADLEA